MYNLHSLFLQQTCMHTQIPHFTHIPSIFCVCTCAQDMGINVEQTPTWEMQATLDHHILEEGDIFCHPFDDLQLIAGFGTWVQLYVYLSMHHFYVRFCHLFMLHRITKSWVCLLMILFWVIFVRKMCQKYKINIHNYFLFLFEKNSL